MQDAFLSARSLECTTSILGRSPGTSLLLVNTAKLHAPSNLLHGIRVTRYLNGKSCGFPDKLKVNDDDVWRAKDFADLEPVMSDKRGYIAVPVDLLRIDAQPQWTQKMFHRSLMMSIWRRHQTLYWDDSG